MRAKRIVKGILTVSGMLLAALLFAVGKDQRIRGDRFLKNVTIQAEGEGFEISRDPSGQDDSFSAWTQCRKEPLKSGSGRTCDADVIAVNGDSGCVYPAGTNLPASDPGGCIIGKKLAEDLFGSDHAMGEKLVWREREWTVRAVVEEPSELCMLQASGIKDQLVFDRISIAVPEEDDRRKAVEEFVVSQGLDAHALRWDYLYGAEWFLEMVPSDWSDFDGWGENLKQRNKAVKYAKTAEKSAIEESGLSYRRRGVIFYAAGFFCVMAGLVIIRWKAACKM